MDEKIVTDGHCSKCEKLVTKRGALAHIKKCFGVGAAESANAFIIRAQYPAQNPIYWLHVTLPFNLTLEHLDAFLRGVWLECCGHMSQFKINGKLYSSHFEYDEFSYFEEFSMSLQCKKILNVGLKFTHDYDFGSTTRLSLEVVGLTHSINPIEVELLMQNQEPQFTCSFCDEKAVNISAYESDFLCKSCTSTDEDDEGRHLPLVNSPRTGVCAYVG